MRLIVLSVCLILASLASSRAPHASALANQGNIQTNPGCKPTAPVDLELLSSRVFGQDLMVDFLVRPRIEARDFSTEIITDKGAEILRHDLSSNFQLQRGAIRTGSIRVRLPADFQERGTQVQLRVGFTFLGSGDDGSTSTERMYAVQLLQLGAPSESPETKLVVSGTETSLDMPAARSN